MKQQNHDRKDFDRSSIDEQISEWMDGESVDPDAYQDILSAAQGGKVFESYHAVGAALRQETSGHWEAGFSERVSQAIADEPAILAPVVMSAKKRMFTGWALAASVAVAFVIGVQTIPVGDISSASGEVAENSSSVTRELVSTNRFAPTGDDTMVAEYHVTEREKVEIDRINTIFAEFAKRNTPSTNTSVPYVRVVSGEQVRTFRMTPQQFRRVMMELEMRNQEANKKAELERRKATP